MTPIGRTNAEVRLLTASGPSALALIEISGPRALDLAFGHFRSLHPQPDPSGSALDRPRYGIWFDRNDAPAPEKVDDVVVCRLGPEEDPRLWITCHGGQRIVERILIALCRDGARVQRSLDPMRNALDDGEVTNLEAPEKDAPDDERGKTMPLSGEGPSREMLLESWLPLVKTRRAARFLAWQIECLPDAIRRARDAAERGDPGPAQSLLSQSASARKLLRGVRVAVVGETNAGKSTLVNRLAGREVSLVWNESGTTRDWVEVECELGGIPVILVDTAGWHSEAEPFEQAAIEAGRERMRRADLRILVLDAERAASGAVEPAALAHGLNDAEIAVWNKADKLSVSARRDWRAERRGGTPELLISAATGDGIEDLIAVLPQRILGPGFWDEHPTIWDAAMAWRLLGRAPMQG